MDSGEIEKKFAESLEKIALIISERDSLAILCKKYQEEIEHQSIAIKIREQKLKDFINHDKIGKIAITMSDDSEELTKTKKMLDEYIKVIDRCIKLLNE